MWIMALSAVLIVLIALYGIIPTFVYKLRNAARRKEKSEKVIFLTFDDGPDKKFTMRLLELLNKYEIKASFFVVALFAEQNPEIIAKMKKDGHCVALHSYEHKNPLWQTPEKVKLDFQRSAMILQKQGVKPCFYRPPWIHFNLTSIQQMKKYNVKPMLCHVMAQDWRANTTADVIFKKLLKRTKGGDIVCLHDGRGLMKLPAG